MGTTPGSVVTGGSTSSLGGGAGSVDSTVTLGDGDTGGSATWPLSSRNRNHHTPNPMSATRAMISGMNTAFFAYQGVGFSWGPAP